MNYVQQIVDRLNELIPGRDAELIRLYALLVLVQGEYVELEDVHNAWALWQSTTQPDHPSIVPFDLLTPEVQALDLPYGEAIQTVARELPERFG